MKILEQSKLNLSAVPPLLMYQALSRLKVSVMSLLSLRDKQTEVDHGWDILQ